MQENTNGHTLLSLHEAKELLGVSRATMFRIIKRNDLPIAKTSYLGKRRYCFFYQSDVINLKNTRNIPLD